eukprot:gene15779-19125_t
MSHTEQGCSVTYCLDGCSGLEMELPGVDQFKYRYYMNGPLADLVSLPTDPKPAASDYPFSLTCYKGCTWADLSAEAAKCAGGSTGVTSGYTNFQKNNSLLMHCTSKNCRRVGSYSALLGPKALFNWPLLKTGLRKWKWQGGGWCSADK